MNKTFDFTKSKVDISIDEKLTKSKEIISKISEITFNIIINNNQKKEEKIIEYLELLSSDLLQILKNKFKIYYLVAKGGNILNLLLKNCYKKYNFDFLKEYIDVNTLTDIDLGLFLKFNDIEEYIIFIELAIEKMIFHSKNFINFFYTNDKINILKSNIYFNKLVKEYVNIFIDKNIYELNNIDILTFDDLKNNKNKIYDIKKFFLKNKKYNLSKKIYKDTHLTIFSNNSIYDLSNIKNIDDYCEKIKNPLIKTDDYFEYNSLVSSFNNTCTFKRDQNEINHFDLVRTKNKIICIVNIKNKIKNKIKKFYFVFSNEIFDLAIVKPGDSNYKNFWFNLNIFYYNITSEQYITYNIEGQIYDNELMFFSENSTKSEKRIKRILSLYVCFMKKHKLSNIEISNILNFFPNDEKHQQIETKKIINLFFKYKIVFFINRKNTFKYAANKGIIKFLIKELKHIMIIIK